MGLTLISCIGVIFAVIFDDKMDETENPTDNEKTEVDSNETEVDSNETEVDSKFVEFNVNQRIDELQLQYDEIIEYSCMESRPQSYFDIVLEERVLEVEHRLRYLSEQQSEIQNIKNEIQTLNENRLELTNESEALFEWECVNQKYWIEEYPHLQKILDR